MHYPRVSFLLLLLLLPACMLQAQSVEGIIKKYVAFIGGEKQWKNIRTLTASGEYDYGGMKFPFTSYAKAPDLYKFIVPLDGKFYAQAYDGKSGWKIDAFKNETTPTLLTGKAARAMANEADVELEDPLIRYKEKGHRVHLEGKDTLVSDHPCFKVLLTRKTGETEMYYFDKTTSALIMKTAVSKNEEMQGSVLTILYDDYRVVGGIKLPFKTTCKAGEQTILTITVDKVLVNEPVEDKEFKP